MKVQDLRKFLFNTLRGRLILSVAAVHAVMMTLFIADLTVRQRAMIQDNQADEAVAMSQSLAMSAAGWIASADISGMQELVEAQRRYPEMLFAMLTDEHGLILAHSDKIKRGLYLIDLPKKAQQTMLNKSVSLVDVMVPAMLGKTHVGWARVGVGQKQASQKLAEIIYSGTLYALGAIAIGSLVAWQMGSRMTRRLYAVQDTIGRVKGGDRTARSGVAGVDEAASIAREFNTMLDALDERDRALLKKEEEARLLLRNIHVAVVVYGPDTRILMSNPMAQELLGLTEEQMTGSATMDPAGHFLREDGSVMPVEEHPVNMMLATRQPLRDAVVGVHRPVLEEDLWLLVSGDPVLDEQGKLTQVVVTCVDITARRKTLEALRINEARFRMGQAIGRIGSWEYNLQTTQFWGSDEAKRMYGFDPAQADFSTEEVENCISERDRVHQALVDLIEQGKAYNLEFEIRPRNSSESRIIASVAELQKDERGNPLKVMGVVQDITERKRADEEISKLNEQLEQRVADRTADFQRKSDELNESQYALINIVEDLNEKTSELEQANAKLKELDRLKSLFIASMSHELRTPLNSIIGFSSIMLNEWIGQLTAEQKDNLAAILRSGKHLLSLINDVIDVSKIEAGKIETFAEEFDVRDVVTEAVETLQKDIEKKGLGLKVSAPRCLVHTDRRRLLQCLLNLVSNAVKYTMQGSISVSAELSTDGSTMAIAVEDTGIGIREDELGSLFLPFVRLHTNMGSIVPGTGLGLYLTKKLAQETLGGDILVTSTHGAGSRFTLQMPVAG